MRKKITILAFFIVTATVAGGVGYNYFDHTQHASSSAEHDGMTIRQFGGGLYKQYDNLEDLEQEAELIIIGKPIKNLQSLKQSQTKRTEYDPLGQFWIDTPIIEKIWV